MERKLHDLARRSPRVIPFGYTDRVPALMAASDVVVTSSGDTCREARTLGPGDRAARRGPGARAGKPDARAGTGWRHRVHADTRIDRTGRAVVYPRPGPVPGGAAAGCGRGPGSVPRRGTGAGLQVLRGGAWWRRRLGAGAGGRIPGATFHARDAFVRFLPMSTVPKMRTGPDGTVSRRERRRLGPRFEPEPERLAQGGVLTVHQEPRRGDAGRLLVRSGRPGRIMSRGVIHHPPSATWSMPIFGRHG